MDYSRERRQLPVWFDGESKGGERDVALVRRKSPRFVRGDSVGNFSVGFSCTDS